MPRINTNKFNSSSPSQYLVLGEEQEQNVSSQCDGSQTTFNVSKTIDADLKVSINGLVYLVSDTNVSFAAGGTSFTLSFAPQSDDVVVAIFKSYQ